MDLGKRIGRAVGLSAALVLAVGIALGFPAGAANAGTTVTVGHDRIEPAEIRVKAGDTVTFHNVDEMPGGHTIEAEDGSFESPPLAKDQEWSHTFEKAGTHPIRIRQHPKATGRVIVE